MSESPIRFLEKKAGKIFSPFEAFVQSQTSTGFLLAGSTIIAMILANTALYSDYQTFIHTEAGLSYDSSSFRMPLKEWVNSGLMALFFFLLGLELKREILAGELQNPQHIGIVLMAALGGIVFPASFYLFINADTPFQNGWAIPMATDTAFALGVLAFLKNRVSPSIFIFLTGLAIFDDLGAIAVIAIYYTESLDLTALWKAGALFVILFGANFAGVRRAWVYIILGILLWWYVHESGVHATLAGIVVALSIPARSSIKSERFVHKIRKLVSFFEKRRQEKIGILADEKQSELINDIEKEAKAAATPLQRWETKLENPIGLVILPLFALFNAGIRLADHDPAMVLASPLILGIIMGLVIGKPVGIVLFSQLAVKLKLGTFPDGITLKDIFGIGLLAGMGFTMSIFISMLAFEGKSVLIEEAKLAILISTFLTAGLGTAWIFLTAKSNSENHHSP